MKNLAQSMADIDNFVKSSNRMIRELENLNGGNSQRHIQSIEIVVKLRVNIIKWSTLRNAANSILTNPSIEKISGTSGYRRRFLDLSNWGEALTKSAVERADLFRQTYRLRMFFESKQEQSKRYASYLNNLKKGLISQNEMRARMIQQTYDIRIDLNEALVTFCEAYFYENLSPCSSNYRPQFGGSLSDLLLRINAAKGDALFISAAPSTVMRTVIIKNIFRDPFCLDSHICPISYLKRYRQILWNLPLYYKPLIDLYKYRVTEIQLDFVGVKTKSENALLKVLIESSGDFKGRDRNTAYNFLTRPLRLTYEYNINTCKYTLNFQKIFVNNSYLQLIYQYVLMCTSHLEISLVILHHTRLGYLKYQKFKVVI